MTVAGLIFSNIHDSEMPEFTSIRTMASVPFGCRYRLIDFPLSNMVNSGITKVGVITHNNYRSLVDHIGTGKDWDLARRSAGIKILPPFITSYDSNQKTALYSGRLEALMGVTNFISRCNEDCVVLCDCDGICNIDLKLLIKEHEKSGAKITLVSSEQEPLSLDASKEIYDLKSDKNGDLLSISKFTSCDDKVDVTTNIMVADRLFLLNKIKEAAVKGYTDFYRDIISKNIGKEIIKVYRYDGTYMLISSLRSYFSVSMKLLESGTRKELFSNSARPIYTKVRNSPPTVYTGEASAKGCYIADGCVIEGQVENSILFRGVRIGKGSIVKNSVLLQDTRVGENVSLNCVITDKNVEIHDRRVLSGHESIPFFLSKGTEV